MEDITKYDLKKDEFKECLNKATMEMLIGAKPSKDPESILIIAQPGAGKTGLRRFVEKEKKEKEGRENYVEIDPDVVGSFHKYQKEILEEFPKESYKLLQKFISPVIDNYLRPEAIKRRYDLIQEGTLGNTPSWLKILDFQKNGGKAKVGKELENGEREEVDLKGGYNIQINVLAVDRFESLLSAHEREQDLRERNIAPRGVTAENHDNVYDSMLNTIQEAQNLKLVNTVRVYKRGKVENEPELIYTSGDDTYPNAVECIKKVRFEERKKLFRNSDKYLERIERLKARVDNENLMQRIEELEEEFKESLKEFEKTEK